MGRVARYVGEPSTTGKITALDACVDDVPRIHGPKSKMENYRRDVAEGINSYC